MSHYQTLFSHWLKQSVSTWIFDQIKWKHLTFLKFFLRLLYLHDRMKYIIVQKVKNDHTNNLIKFEKKIHHSIFEYFNDKH